MVGLVDFGVSVVPDNVFIFIVDLNIATYCIGSFRNGFTTSPLLCAVTLKIIFVERRALEEGQYNYFSVKDSHLFKIYGHIALRKN